jgi:rubrerythrin
VIRNGARVPPEDVAPLNELLDAEHYGVRAYAAAIPLLGSAAAKDARWLLSQELAHVVELSELVMQAKAKPRRPAASYNLGNPQTSSEALTLLEHAERVQLKAYLETIPKLSGGRVRAAVATLSANDAQHLALLRSRAGQPPTTAFATG